MKWKSLPCTWPISRAPARPRPAGRRGPRGSRSTEDAEASRDRPGRAREAREVDARRHRDAAVVAEVPAHHVAPRRELAARQRAHLAAGEVEHRERERA